MRQIELEELKVLQMDVLSAVHQFCLEHDLRYSLACGTMLGAARHKGYIPWDDDIDIYLLREDYNRMMMEFPDLLDGNYKFCTLERTKHWSLPYGKIVDTRTLLYEGDEHDNNMGVNIDVFPIDNVPDDECEWKKYDKKRRNLYYIYDLRKYLHIFRVNKEKSIIRNIFAIFAKLLISAVGKRYLAKIFQKMAIKYNSKETVRVFECVQGIYQKHPFPKSLFNNRIMMPFEDRQYMCFADYDAYLTNGFGNWRELPPVEKRVSHHSFTAWWKSN